MKAMQRLILLVVTLLSLVFVPSCTNDRSRTVHHVKYTQYHVYHHNDDGSYVWLWYYVMLSNHGGYYYYSSPTQVSNFSTVNWTTSTTTPITDEDKIESQQEETLTAEDANLTSEMQSDLPSEEATEALPSEIESTTEPSESSPSSEPSEGGSSSEPSEGSGGGDSGGSSGGDSGGGDGGGGGD